IAIAAAVPAFLYFFGLFVQIDARAARDGLTGMPEKDLPNLRETLKEGWHHVFAIALLVFMLIWMRRESLAPYYATAALLVVNQIVSKTNRWGMKDVWSFIDSSGKLFSNLVGI